MKALIIILFFGTIFGSGYMPKWWNSPHGYLLNYDQSKIFKKDSTTKPDLKKIKENLYMPIEATVDGVMYKGLVTVKPTKGSDQLKVGEAIYQQKDTDQISLVDGEIVERENYYQIFLKSKNASQFFKSRTAYQHNVEIPITLEIRSHGKNNIPYLINPLDKTETQRVRFLPYQMDIEKPFVGWPGYLFAVFLEVLAPLPLFFPRYYKLMGVRWSRI